MCFTGAKQGGTDCGTVEAIGENVTYTNGVKVAGLARASLCSNPGDSGSPVYANRSAKGLISGGSEDPQDCTAYYQGIRGAENLMNVNVSFEG